MPGERDEGLLPWGNAEEFVQWSAVKLAEGILGGLAGAIVGEVVDRLLGEGPSAEELLEAAVRRFAEKVEQAVREEALRQAAAQFSSLSIGIEEARRGIVNSGPAWWTSEGEVEIDKIKQLDYQACDLVENLKLLELAGWQSYMLAGSLRLRIFATLMQVPGQELTQRENISEAIKDYTNHHRAMCEKVNTRLWPGFEIQSAYTYRQCWRVHPTRPYHFFPVYTNAILELLRGVKITNYDWLFKMPPVADIGISSSRDWHRRGGFGPDERWYYWKSGILAPDCASAIYTINELSGLSVETIHSILRMRRTELELWVWSQYNKGFAGSLHDITVEWLKSQDKVRRVAIRASNGRYVTALVGAEYRGALYASKKTPHPWAVFDLIAIDGDKVALRAVNKHYVAAELYSQPQGREDYEVELVANRRWIREWETFRQVGLEENKVALLADNDKYVALKETAEPEVSAPKLIAYRDEIVEEATFELVEVRQGRWRHSNLTSLTGAPLADGTPSGYTWDVDDTQHVVYRGEDRHIHELWFRQNSGWHHEDLTAAISGIPSAIGNLACYTWAVDKTQHIIYVDPNYLVRELWFSRDSGWHHNNLSAAAGAPPARGDICGYTWYLDSAQHVVYRGRDNHLHHLSFSQASGWHHNDLTDAADAPLSSEGVAGYTWDVDETQHVVYRGQDGHIHELWFNQDTGWRRNDLTAAAGAPPATVRPSGYTWCVDRTQHVVYRGRDDHIHELWFSQNTGWRRNDLTAATGAPSAVLEPSGYTWDGDDTQHVVYRGKDRHIHELWYHRDSGWHHHDLTRTTGAPLARSAPVGYTWDVDGTQHVVYIGEDGNIHELWFARWQAA